MAEHFDPTNAYGAVAGSTSLSVASLLLDWEGARIHARFVGNAGHRYNAQWDGATATSLMVALNKANLTTNSLHKRLINQALTDGKLPAGSISGSPD